MRDEYMDKLVCLKRKSKSKKTIKQKIRKKKQLTTAYDIESRRKVDLSMAKLRKTKNIYEKTN